MAENSVLKIEVRDKDDRDVTGTMPYFQWLNVERIEIQRIQDYPTPDGPIPHFLARVRLLHEKPLEATRTPPKDGDTPKSTPKQTKAQKQAVAKEKQG